MSHDAQNTKHQIKNCLNNHWLSFFILSSQITSQNILIVKNIIVIASQISHKSSIESLFYLNKKKNVVGECKYSKEEESFLSWISTADDVRGWHVPLKMSPWKWVSVENFIFLDMFIEYLSLFHSRLIKHELGKDKYKLFKAWELQWLWMKDGDENKIKIPY